MTTAESRQSNTTETNQATYRTLFWLLVGGLTVFRLVFAGRFGLGVDESHYLLFSRHLAWGYFDHPPMVAFLAAVTTLGGEGVFWVRLGPVFCSGVSLILLRYLALELYHDERVGFWAAVLLQLMPYQHLLMVALLPDAPLNLFWCATLLAVRRAVRTGRWTPWILTGLLFGGALLSKYHGLLLAGCLLGYFITSAKYRFWLTKSQPWAAVLIGGAVFLPNVVWNARHGWISYAYQLGHAKGDGLSAGKFLLALAAQFGVWSPLVFGLLIVATVAIVRQKPINDEDRFILWTSLPVFAFFCLAGWTGKILPHWTAAGWWSGSIAVAAVIVRRGLSPGPSAKRWRRWTAGAMVTGLVMSVLVYAVLLWPLVAPVYSRARDISLKLNARFPAVRPLKPFESGFDPSNDLFGWPQIADEVEAIRAQMPHPAKTFVFCRRFYMTSQLAVYLPPATVATSLQHKFNQYRLWFSAPGHAGWDALFVVKHGRHRERARSFRPVFESMDPVPLQITVFRNGWPAHELEVYKFYGFKGRSDF